MSLKQRLSWQEEPVFLIDGSSFVYRAFYAFPDLARSDGFPTNALFILMRVLLKIIREERPAYGCFFLDGPGPTFREEVLPDYKAQRQRMPEALARQLEPIARAVPLLGLPLEVSQGQEADDLIASLSQRLKDQCPVVIVGGDKDLFQCLHERVVVWDPGQRTEKLVTRKGFVQERGLQPEQWPDFQALVGDKSDNIPGIPGIGPKTAQKLLHRFPDLESLSHNLEHLGRKEQEKLLGHLEELFVFRRLTRLRTDLLPETGLSDLRWAEIQTRDLAAFCQEFEFKTLARDLAAHPEASEPGGGRSLEAPAADTDPAEMPDLEKQAVGLYPDLESGGCVLGWAGSEIRCRLTRLDLGSALARAERVYVPALKPLLQARALPETVDPDRFVDLGLAAYLLQPEERDYGWERLLQAFGPEIEASQTNPGLACLQLGRLLENRLEAAELLALLYLVELPLVPVLARMESRGVAIDLTAFQAFLAEVEARLAELTQAIFDQAGTSFNLRSTQQLSEILFQKLGLRPGTKTPGGLPSTSVAVLQQLQGQHPIIDLILDYRTLEKLRSTYLEPLPRQVWPDGRLHTSFNQTGTATGRLSSSRPNLQNIPIRGAFGPRLRSCFVAPAGHSLIAADYSQIELRILAHLSQDEHLLEAFARQEDIHTRTAGLLFDRPSQAIGPEERRKAKTINFGLLYGMGPQKLSRELGIAVKEAKRFIELYFERLPGVSAFYQEVGERARSQGFVTTLAGRRRLLRDINSRNQNLAAQAMRMAINTVVQGSAADIIKLAMIQADADPVLRMLQTRLLLQIHDELLLEAPAASAEAAGERVAQVMASVMELSVPLLVDWGTGPDWAQAH